MDKAYYKSPIGIIEVIGDGESITEIHFCDCEISEASEIYKIKDIPFYIDDCIKQLSEYFDKKRKTFDLKLNPKGTEFQKKVWNELLKIPYGETRSYKDIAENIGNPKAVRAVGGANNKNPIAICIPCHRVIGKSGKLVGYAGGLDKKEYLLNIEK